MEFQIILRRHNIPKEQQIAFVKDFSPNILLILDPCEEAQLEAVKNDINSLKFISDPCEKAKILHRNLHTMGAPVNFRCPVCTEGKLEYLILRNHPDCRCVMHRKCIETLVAAKKQCPTLENAPKIPEDFVCPICLDEQNKKCVSTLHKCGHSFHSTCIYMWRKNNKTCPVCRAN